MHPTPETVFNHYDSLSRRRALLDHESRALERAIRELDGGVIRPTHSKRGYAHEPHEWSDDEDALILRERRLGVSFRVIGIKMGRTKSAVHNRYMRLMRDAVPA